MKKIKMLQVLGVLLLSVGLWGCASSKSGGKDSVDHASYTKVEQWVDQKAFTIVADWANPLNGNQVNFYGNRFNISSLLPPGSGGSRVNLIGNPNSLSIKKDSVNGYLPYYGEVQVVKNYGSNHGGLNFDGFAENYKVNKLPEDGKIKISFETVDESENYQVYITLYGTKKAQININSPYRHSISYDGSVKELKDEDKITDSQKKGK